MEKLRTLKSYVLPGLVFQSVVIAGGYGTGRELAEFFLSYGPTAGLLSMLLVSTVLWSLVCAATFELARRFELYDYRHFIQKLLGKAWILYEICYVVLLLIVLAVIAAAAGSILQESFHLAYSAGVVAMMLAVGTLVFLGSETIERFLSLWSVLLYAVYLTLVAGAFYSFGDDILNGFREAELTPGWAMGGVRYAAYNLGVVPAVLFAVRHCRTRRQAVGAGLLAGPIAMIPGLFFFLAMVGKYPEILDREVPASFLLEALGSPLFQLTFQVVLFGTLIETGTGLIHAVNERVAGFLKDRGRSLTKAWRGIVASVLLLGGVAVAQFGLTGLVARGYGTITWGFLLLFVVPVLTIGVWKATRPEGGPS